jgi:hypothetical protein
MDDQRTNRESGVNEIPNLKLNRFRFSLAGLLLAMTAISFFFGYAQLRRQSVLRQVKELEVYGVKLHVRERWANLIWPEVAKDATFAYQNLEDGRIVAGLKTYDPLKDGRAIMLDDRSRFELLDALGVENCDTEWNNKRGKHTSRTSVKAALKAVVTAENNLNPTH